METARFYGILVPCEGGWEFVHRTLHDFLAAQYWVETGEFARVTSYEWNARTAYAACRMHDSTRILEAALASKDGYRPSRRSWPTRQVSSSVGWPRQSSIIFRNHSDCYTSTRRVQCESPAPWRAILFASEARDF